MMGFEDRIGRGVWGLAWWGFGLALGVGGWLVGRLVVGMSFLGSCVA